MSRGLIPALSCILLILAASCSAWTGVAGLPATWALGNTIAEAQWLPCGTSLNLLDKVVTAGTDQTDAAFFYIQDGTAGIRVRSSAGAQQGDRISVTGTIRQTGVEREIEPSKLTVTYGPFPMPTPVTLDGNNDIRNLGKLCRITGQVTSVDAAKDMLHISGSAARVLVPPGTPLAGIVGKYATVTGVLSSGSTSSSPLLIRATCEPFLDLNLNGYWDRGEPFIDADQSGSYDGIQMAGIPSPNLTSGFDRYGTAILRGKPFLPKGIYIYTVNDPTLDEMVRQGFNTVVCFDMDPGALASIGSRGLKTLPCLRSPEQRPAWMAVKNDPAILGWYIHDEPEGQGTSAAQALIDRKWVKSQDPTHFAGESHFLRNGFYDYAAADDFAISDCYPLTDPSATVIPIAGVLDYAKGAHGGSCYPAWQFVQLFGAAPQVLPTAIQVRAMTYLALASHARGIMYFSYQRLNSQWYDDWAEVKELNGEMDLFRGFLTMPWVPLDATTSTEAVRIGGVRVGGSALIITVNVTSSPQTVTFRLPGIGADSLSLPLEGTTQVLSDRSFTCKYEPYQTRVFVWGKIPAAP